MEVNLKEILNIKPENLAHQQQIFLRNYVINHLRNIIELIEDGDYDEVHDFIECSPAGDECGIDNRYIAFDDATPRDQKYKSDIGDVIDRLIELKNIAEEYE